MPWQFSSRWRQKLSAEKRKDAIIDHKVEDQAEENQQHNIKPAWPGYVEGFHVASVPQITGRLPREQDLNDSDESSPSHHKGQKSDSIYPKSAGSWSAVAISPDLSRKLPQVRRKPVGLVTKQGSRLLRNIYSGLEGNIPPVTSPQGSPDPFSGSRNTVIGASGPNASPSNFSFTFESLWSSETEKTDATVSTGSREESPVLPRRHVQFNDVVEADDGTASAINFETKSCEARLQFLDERRPPHDDQETSEEQIGGAEHSTIKSETRPQDVSYKEEEEDRFEELGSNVQADDEAFDGLTHPENDESDEKFDTPTHPLPDEEDFVSFLDLDDDFSDLDGQHNKAFSQTAAALPPAQIDRISTHFATLAARYALLGTNYLSIQAEKVAAIREFDAQDPKAEDNRIAIKTSQIFTSMCICDPKIQGNPVTLHSADFRLGASGLEVGACKFLNLPPSEDGSGCMLHVEHGEDGRPRFIINVWGPLVDDEQGNKRFTLASQVDVTNAVRRLAVQEFCHRRSSGPRYVKPEEAVSENSDSDEDEVALYVSSDASHSSTRTPELPSFMDSDGEPDSWSLISSDANEQSECTESLTRTSSDITEEAMDPPLHHMRRFLSFMYAIYKHHAFHFVLLPDKKSSSWTLRLVSPNLFASPEMACNIKSTPQETLIAIATALDETKPFVTELYWGEQQEEKVVYLVPVTDGRDKDDERTKKWFVGFMVDPEEPELWEEGERLNIEELKWYPSLI